MELPPDLTESLIAHLSGLGFHEEPERYPDDYVVVHSRGRQEEDPGPRLREIQYPPVEEQASRQPVEAEARGPLESIQEESEHSSDDSEQPHRQHVEVLTQEELEEQQQSPPQEQELKYGKRQETGAQRRRWIDDPSESDCNIPVSTLTIDKLRLLFQVMKPKNIPVAFTPQVLDLGLPNEWDKPVKESVYRYFSVFHDGLTWKGYTGPGVIFIDEVKRKDESVPPISQVTQAFYEKDFAMSTLRYVFVTYAINADTFDNFIRRQLYTARNNLQWPPMDNDEQVWTFGTPEYDALLGTVIGRLVAHLVLGAFDRGTRRISQIVTWPTEDSCSCHMRFDIEVVE